MGIKASTPIKTEPFRSQQWERIEKKNHSLDYGRFNVVRNIRTGALADEYFLTWNTEEEYFFYLKSYNWRSKKNHCESSIVNSLYIKQLSREDMCTKQYSANVYLDHIESRLSEISDIPYPDNLYMLLQALQGYQRLYQHAGYFPVEEDQICIDKTGNVKVWVNSDLAKNYPQTDMGGSFSNLSHYSQKNSIDETKMVSEIVELVAKNTDAEDQPVPSFLEEFNRKNKLNKYQMGFEMAKIVVISYAKQNRTLIPHRFETIFELYSHKQEGKDQSSLHLSQVSKPCNQQINYQHRSFTKNNSSPQLLTYPNPHFIPNYESNPQQNHFYIYPQRPQYPMYQIETQNHVSPQFLRRQSHPYASNPIAQPPKPEVYYAEPQTKTPLNIPRQPPQQFYPKISSKRSSKYSGVQSNDSSSKKCNFSKKSNSKKRQMGINHKVEQEYEFEDLEQQFDNVIKSLPLQTGYPSSSTFLDNQLSDKYTIIYSHIQDESQENYRQINNDGFGLGNRLNQFQDKFCVSYNMKRNDAKKRHNDSTNKSSKKQNTRYFSSLSSQYDMDPEIAADMVKYFS